jgi:hypothetical protein
VHPVLAGCIGWAITGKRHKDRFTMRIQAVDPNVTSDVKINLCKIQETVKFSLREKITNPKLSQGNVN